MLREWDGEISKHSIMQNEEIKIMTNKSLCFSLRSVVLHVFQK